LRIESIKRPWSKETQRRYNRDPRYNSPAWKQAVRVHKQGTTTLPNGETISNAICYDCYVESKKVTPMHTVDHHIRVKDGADFWDSSNYRSLCSHHHAVKSAKEAQL
jgi:hypothetical protein